MKEDKDVIWKFTRGLTNSDLRICTLFFTLILRQLFIPQSQNTNATFTGHKVTSPLLASESCSRKVVDYFLKLTMACL